MAGLTLDAGPLILVQRGDREMFRWLMRAAETGRSLTIPATALAQAWRGPQSATLALVLAAASVAVLDEVLAKRVGVLCARSRTSDVIDASVVVVADSRGDVILTTDRSDISRLAAFAPGVVGVMTPADA